MIQDREAILDKLKAQHKLISEDNLPTLFDDAGITEITAANGVKIKLSKFYVGNVKNPDAMKWLEDNGFDTIIDNTFTVKFQRGEETDAKQLETDLDDLGVPYTRKEAIHHARLKSFINEQIEQNPDFPQDVFNVVAISRVKSK